MRDILSPPPPCYWEGVWSCHMTPWSWSACSLATQPRHLSTAESAGGVCPAHCWHIGRHWQHCMVNNMVLLSELALSTWICECTQPGLQSSWIRTRFRTGSVFKHGLLLFLHILFPWFLARGSREILHPIPSSHVVQGL